MTELWDNFDHHGAFRDFTVSHDYHLEGKMELDIHIALQTLVIPDDGMVVK